MSNVRFPLPVLLAALLAAAPVFAQAPPPPDDNIELKQALPPAQDPVRTSRGDRLTLKIAVMGPGDELYFWWGHIALVIDDAFSGESRFYDYGVFFFESEHFFRNYAFGRPVYMCAVSPAEASLNIYRATNRDITLYTLDLPGDVKEAVRRFAENNVLPENKDYYYHNFRDNCATRIRDLLDMATAGAFKARYGEAPGRFTLRQHVRRHTWFNPFGDWILNFLMGQVIDRPLTVWEEMFLPSEIGRRIEDFSYTGVPGGERRLVSQVEVLNRAVNRPAVLEVPRRQWPRELLFSLFLSGLFAFFFYLAKKGRLPWLPGTAQALAGLFFGLAGSVLFFMAFFTNHDYTYENSNLLFANPLLLLALPLGLLSAFSRLPARRFMAASLLRSLWTYVFLGGLLAMAIKGSPRFYQQNQVDLALLMPPAFTLSFIPHWIGRLLKRAGRKAPGA